MNDMNTNTTVDNVYIISGFDGDGDRAVVVVNVPGFSPEQALARAGLSRSEIIVVPTGVTQVLYGSLKSNRPE